MRRISIENVETVTKFGAVSIFLFLSISAGVALVSGAQLDPKHPAVLAVREKAARMSSERLREIAADRMRAIDFDEALSDCGFVSTLFVSRETRAECAAISLTDLPARWNYAYRHALLDRRASGAAPPAEASVRMVETLPADAPKIDRLLRIAGAD